MANEFGLGRSYDALTAATLASADKFGIWQESTSRLKLLTVEELLEYVQNATFLDGPSGSDDTSTFVAAAAAGGLITVGPGTWLVDMNEVVCTTETHWRLHPQAIIKARSAPLELAILIDFTSAAAGSSFEGGIIDGNRDTLGADFTDPDWNWTGLRALNVNDFTLRNVRIQNCVSFAFWVQGEDMIVENIWATACGKVSQVKKCKRGVFRNIWGIDIGNDGLEVYQHANEWRDLEDCVFENIFGVDFQPDATGPEPKPHFITFETSTRIRLAGVRVTGYSGTSSSGTEAGVGADTCEDIDFSDIHVKGYRIGCILQSCSGVLRDSVFDGEYLSSVDDAVQVLNTGIVESATGILATNTRMIRTGQRLRLVNVLGKRHKTAFDIRAQQVDLIDCRGLANNEQGLLINSSTQITLFGEVEQVARDITIHGGEYTENGLEGALLQVGDDIKIIGADFRNNGQDSSAGANQRVCFRVETTATNIRITDSELGDAQDWTAADAISFEPGTTDADDRYEVELLDPQRIRLGAWINLVGAESSSDVIARVVDLDYKRDRATLQFEDATTLTSTGLTTALTGTLSSSGTTVTGSGTAFLTEITGPLWISDDGTEWRQVRRVNSDTELILEEAFSADLSGATVNKLTADVEGIPSMQYRLRTTKTSQDIFWRDNVEGRVVGATTPDYSIAALTCFAPGSRIQRDTPEAGIALSTGGATTNLISGIPIGWESVGVATIVTTAIAGTSGATHAIDLVDSGGTIENVGNFATGAQNDKVTNITSSFGIRTSGNMVLQSRIHSGADNTPSAGAIRARWVLERHALVALPNV